MGEMQDLDLLIAGRAPVVLVESLEGERVEALVVRSAARNRRMAFRWSLATGLVRLDPQPGPPNRTVQEPQRLLGHILALTQPCVFLLYDFGQALEDPLVISHLREIAARCDEVPQTLVLIGPELPLPADLGSACSRLAIALPTRDELDQLIRQEAQEWTRTNRKPVRTDAVAVDALVRTLAGLNLSDARRLVRSAIQDGVLDQADLPPLMDAKYKLLDQGGALTFELKSVTLDDVAGMGKLKTWLAQRRSIFLASKPPAGLDPPKGLLLLGVQGGGKSLAAKAVAGAWGVPLLRLDFATLYNKYYGETERNLRDSLKTAGAMAPCVLWIDEIEKGLATDSGEDGGPGKRVLGSLLTWMVERKEHVFLVATANDIEALPPELLRKGRFDEIFFVDLPSPEARKKTFEIHLKKRGHDPAAFDTARLAVAAEGFSGAEIEQAVVSALYAVHARNEPLKADHIRAELAGTRPLSVVMAEKIAALRAWARERTVSVD